MAGTAKKTDPKLWDRVKDEVTKSEKGGKPGQWSAHKAASAGRSARSDGPTKAELLKRAKATGVKGRSTMSKGELEQALGA